MDFERVITTLAEKFKQQQVRYAVMGGFALGILGVPRATMDLDVLVHGDDLGSSERILRELGYLRYAQTPNVSHYRHQDSVWGVVDLIHALRPASLSMLTRAKVVPILDGQWTIRVLPPEDVIGFKIQGMANDPLRQAHETVDIESLAARYGKGLDWPRIEAYYAMFNMPEEGRRLRKRFGDV